MPRPTRKANDSSLPHSLECSLVGQEHTVTLIPGTRARELYGVSEAVEDYFCNYGINPEYLPALEKAGLRVSVGDREGEVRIVELPGHPFFVATLFVPQTRSTPDYPHPLLAGYAAAGEAYNRTRR